MSRINEAASKRWERAQATERQFWDEVVTGGEEFIRITTEKLRCVDLVKRHVPQALQHCSGKSTQVVEIGIGPLAVGVGSLLEPAETWRLTGVEPQPRRDCDFPEFIMAAYRVLQQRPVTYVQAKGEATGLRADSFDLAFCYNVIDHTPNWRGILVEVYRILKPSGYFVLTVDVLCLASYLRWAWILRWLASSDANVVAHPSRFTAFQLERLLPRFGFEQLWAERHTSELRHRILGKARRLTVIARKPPGVSRA